jgi:hypothetical protein
MRQKVQLDFSYPQVSPCYPLGFPQQKRAQRALFPGAFRLLSPNTKL